MPLSNLMVLRYVLVAAVSVVPLAFQADIASVVANLVECCVSSGVEFSRILGFPFLTLFVKLEPIPLLPQS
jgi:hypothetical protein